MLCFRCGSHVQDGADKCWNCGTRLTQGTGPRKATNTMELRTRQRTGSRIFGVVFKIGDLIANRYRVTDIIGSGGVGVVYRAHDQEIDVDVAVKVINAKLVQTADEQRLFSRQTKIARKLSHQNVVRIYDEGRDEDRPFFTMQFLEGLSLRKIIDLRKEKQQTFALTEVEPIYNQLCQALDYAHKTSFHGDLKPDNVIVLPDLLKVTDFALLRGLPRKPFLAIQKSRAGNFRYLAPEVRLEVNELDKGVDLYSLGVILCEMITGLLYDDAKPEQLNLSSAQIDPALVQIIKRCVARAPKDRYLAAGDLYEDLRSAMLKGLGKTAGRTPPPQAEPPHLAEAPTQRLDISRHGVPPEPAVDPAAARAAEARRAQPALEGVTRPAPVEVAMSVAVPDEASFAPRDEVSGTFATIDDSMIESAAPSAADAQSAAPHAEPPSPVAAAASIQVAEAETPARSVHSESPPPELGTPDQEDLAHHEEEETEALEGELMEISNSAIELIADPRATNLFKLQGEARVDAVHRGAPEQPTQQPQPLPDSAVPSPAFAQAVAREATALGRLDGHDEVLPIPPPADSVRVTPVAPEVVVRGHVEGGPAALGAEAPRPQKPRTMIPRAPTAAMEPAPTNGSAAPKNGRPAKSRPMTRPRMSAIPAIVEPVVSDPLAQVPKLFDNPPAPEELRLPTGARPLMVTNGAVKTQPEPGLGRPITEASMVPGAVAPIPLAVPSSNNRSLILTVILSVAALIAVLVVFYKLNADAAAQREAEFRALKAELLEMQKLKAEAGRREADERKAAAEAEKGASEAKKAEELAAAQAVEAQKKKEEAAKEAERLAAEAKKKEQELHKADDGRKAALKKEQDEANRVAAAKRAEAAAEEKREREERAKEESERKKREREEQKKLEAERRAEREAEAKRKAEEREAELQAQREAKAEADRLKKEKAEEAKAKREEDAKAKAEEQRLAEEKKADEEAKKKAAEEEAKKQGEGEGEVALAAAAVTGAGGKSCPKGMAYIEGGPFMLGAPQNDPERDFGDLPYKQQDVPAFCVDYYEYPNGRDRVPQSNLNWKAAVAACKKKSKRLCTEAEWEKSCKGPNGSRYPYGNQWDPAACATEDESSNPREVAKSGEFKRCRSGFNVFDMSGNVAEWTATEYGAGGYVVKGGSADRPGYNARCASRKKKKGADAEPVLGFRCCADPS